MTNGDISSVVGGAGLLLAGGAITWALQARAAKVKADVEWRERVVALESRMALVQQQVVPIAAAFQALLVKELTHYHTPVMDALMVKLGPPNTLTDEEEGELAYLLKQRTVDMGDQITPSERNAAEMLPFVMKRVRAEQAAGSQPASVQVVALPVLPNKESD